MTSFIRGRLRCDRVCARTTHQAQMLEELAAGLEHRCDSATHTGAQAPREQRNPPGFEGNAKHAARSFQCVHARARALMALALSPLRTHAQPCRNARGVLPRRLHGSQDTEPRAQGGWGRCNGGNASVGWLWHRQWRRRNVGWRGDEYH